MENNNPGPETQSQPTIPTQYQQSVPKQLVKQRGYLIPIVAVVLLISMVGAGVYYLRASKNKLQTENITVSPTSDSTTNTG